jgi:hypothetical protein
VILLANNLILVSVCSLWAYAAIFAWNFLTGCLVILMTTILLLIS